MDGVVVHIEGVALDTALGALVGAGGVGQPVEAVAVGELKVRPTMPSRDAQVRRSLNRRERTIILGLD